jgi:hypothetical protein
MRIQKALCIAISMMLIIACTAGCGNLFGTEKTTSKTIYTTTPETTLDFKDKSVKDLLGISLDTVQTLKIVRAGDGLTVVIEDKVQIERILNRLSQVLFGNDLGKQGYTPDGYNFDFTIKDQNGERFVGIQLDTSDYSYIGNFQHHFYAIVDEGASSGEDLNTFIEKAKYS